MIEETRKIYRCQYCKKVYLLKHFAEKHELICDKNPKNNRICYGCEYLTKKTIRYENLENHRPVNLLYCNKLDVFLHPPKVEIKGNLIETGNDEPMKKKCEHHKDEWEC